jgi:hypothetical protein
VLREAGDDLWKRHLRELRGGDVGTRAGEHFNPQSKSRRIELLIEPGSRRPP